MIRTSRRNELKLHLLKSNVDTLIHYPVPPHLQVAYSDLGFRKGDFAIAEEISDTCLSLPIYPGLSDEAIDFITDAIGRFY